MAPFVLLYLNNKQWDDIMVIWSLTYFFDKKGDINQG